MISVGQIFEKVGPPSPNGRGGHTGKTFKITQPLSSGGFYSGEWLCNRVGGGIASSELRDSSKWRRIQ